jgi:hypothetical protein
VKAFSGPPWVIAVAALAAVVLWAATSWLWLVVHEGLH